MLFDPRTNLNQVFVEDYQIVSKELQELNTPKNTNMYSKL